MQFEVANGSRKGCALLFRNVQNAGRLRPKLISGELDASLVDASLVSLLSTDLSGTRS